jgi:hypothetical protein
MLASLVCGCGVTSVSGVALDSGATCAIVSPSPGTHTAATDTPVKIRGVDAGSVTSAQIGIVGSLSGHHQGHWVPDADGRGAGFYPTSPFTAGEQVTVTVGVPICGARHGRMTFSIAIQPGSPAPAAAAPTSRDTAPWD